jgi:RNA polymerase sigma-70 factor (ECF subfamily)
MEDLLLLAPARAGQADAFDALVAPARRLLLAHCYRMLGSAFDAEDAVQETLVRAWRAIGQFEGRSSIARWLCAIATRVCLDRIAARPSRTLPGHDARAPSVPGRPLLPPVVDPVWLEPLADDAWCDGDPDAAETPESTCTRRESVAVAFLAAIQLLPASQRAALLLQEVAGWRAEDIAAALETTVPAVNSLLQRARATLAARAPGWNGRARTPSPVETDVLARYLRAWNEADPALLATTLREDAILSMPPIPDWYAGRDAFVAFFSGFLSALPGRGMLRPAGFVNGAPAFASYRSAPDAPGRFHADGLHVVELDGAGNITAVVAFLGAAAVTGCGLAEVIEG